ncbi:MAG: sphingomyelin phosphodiesterase [Chitinophagales bacterium]
MLRLFAIFICICTLYSETGLLQAQVNEAKFDEDTFDLKVLSWNLYLLPRFFKPTKQLIRAKYIAERLVEEDYDALMLQEVFGKLSSTILHKGLKEHYPYYLGPANKKGSPFKANSGVMIYSKYPLELLTEFQFEDCKGIDCWGRKGGLLAAFEKDGQEYQIMSTHLQAFEGDKRDKIRLLQYHQILRDVVLPYSKDGVPQILGGDYNTMRRDSFYYDAMLSVMNASNSPCVGDTICTYVSFSNDLINSGEYELVLDYVFLRNNGVKFSEEKRKVRVFQADWDPRKRRRKGKRKDLSDHYAVELKLKK